MYIPLLEVETPLFNFTPFVGAGFSFFFLVTVEAVGEYIIFPVMILRLPRLSTRVKPRKHKSNKLAGLF